MTKFTIRGGTRLLIGFVFGRDNLERMMSGDPVLIKLDALDPSVGPVDVLISAGETDLEAMAVLEEKFGFKTGPETRVNIDSRRKM